MKTTDLTGRNEEIRALFPQMFTIISANMSTIAPTGNTLEEDRRSWTRAMVEELRNPEKRWIISQVNGVLTGYLLYRVNAADNVIHMDEIQIAEVYQGDGVTFLALIAALLRDSTVSGATLRSYANRQNTKSQGILQRMGLAVVGETERGFRFEGRGSNALAWFTSKYGASNCSDSDT